MPSCKAMYCSNTHYWNTLSKMPCFQFPNPETERKRADIWLKDIGTDYNINTLHKKLSQYAKSVA